MSDAAITPAMELGPTNIRPSRKEEALFESRSAKVDLVSGTVVVSGGKLSTHDADFGPDARVAEWRRNTHRAVFFLTSQGGVRFSAARDTSLLPNRVPQGPTIGSGFLKSCTALNAKPSRFGPR